MSALAESWAVADCPQTMRSDYLHDLASDFQCWYNAHKVIMDDAGLRNARLTLSKAVRQVIKRV